MAERNVAVRLSANVSQYTAAMAKAKAATTGLSDSSSSLTRLGGTLQSVGKMATVGVTLPLLAVGAGAVSMAAKFDTAFAQMQGLANVPAAEIDTLKESVLSLAGETAVAPQELAEGLYFAASAGLDAAAAMDAVDLAARASAAGMGSTKDVVGLVASAVAAYGAENITAAEATDILAATIREGRAEPAELASTLGQVLPIAAELGVTFDDVGAATALLTNVFGDTSRSVTSLSGLLSKLSAPTKAGREALADFGLTAEDIRQAISEDGLQGALKLLTDSGLAGSAEAMAKLFDDVEARRGALVLLNTDAATLNATFGALDNSAGSLDTAFDAVADTAGFKMKQAMTDIKVAMIQIGDLLLPFAAGFASTMSGVIGWFTDLNPAVQGVVVAFGGLLAAAGPVASIAGTLMKNWTQLAGVFGVSESAAGKMGKTLGAVGLIVGTVFAVWKILDGGILNVTDHIDTSSDALGRQTIVAFTNAVAAGEATTQIDALAIANVALSNALAEAADEELSASMARLNVTSDQWLDTLVALGSDGITPYVEQQRLLSQAFDMNGSEALRYFDAIRSGVSDHEELAAAAGVTVEVYDSVMAAMASVTGFATENSDEINTLALAYLDLQGSIPGVTHDALEAAEAIAGNRAEAGNAVPVYQEYVHQLELLDPAQRDALMSSDEWQASLAALPPELRAAITGTEDLTGATEELATVQASSIDTMSQAQDYLSDLEHTLSEYSSGLDTALGHGGDWVRQHYDMAKGFREFADAITDGDGEIDLMTQGLDANTEAGYENAGTILDMADGIIAMTKSNIMAGKSQAEVTAEYESARTALIDAAVAAGLNREDVEALIDTYGLVPELVTTAMNIANDALMKWRIDRYLEKLDEIPEDVAVQLEAAIDDNDWATANRIINDVTADRSVNIYANPIGFGGLTGRGWASHALGAYIPQPEVAMLHGNEAVLPLGNAARMRQLVADPRIGEPLMAAMSQVGSGVSAALGRLTPYSAPLTAGSATGGVGSSSSVVNVVVNMPPGADGDDVVRALKKWQRQSGPLPLAVRSA